MSSLLLYLINTNNKIITNLLGANHIPVSDVKNGRYLILWLFLRLWWTSFLLLLLLAIIFTFLWPLRKNLLTLQRIISPLSEWLKHEQRTCYKLNIAVPSGCDSSGFRSKMPPDSCWASAWPSLCKQTAPGSSLRLVRGWSGSYPGESEYEVVIEHY